MLDRYIRGHIKTSIRSITSRQPHKYGTTHRVLIWFRISWSILFHIMAASCLTTPSLCLNLNNWALKNIFYIKKNCNCKSRLQNIRHFVEALINARRKSNIIDFWTAISKLSISWCQITKPKKVVMSYMIHVLMRFYFNASHWLFQLVANSNEQSILCGRSVRTFLSLIQ